MRSCFYTKPASGALPLRLASDAAPPANGAQMRPALHVVGAKR